MVVRVQAVTDGVGVAGVRAAAGHRHPDDDHRRAGHHGEPGQGPHCRWHHGHRRAVRLAHPAPQGVRDEQQQHRHHEVDADDRGMQLGTDGDPTDHRLCHDAEHDRQRQRHRTASPGTVCQGGQQGGARDQHQHEREQPVAELDRSVHAHLGGGGVRLVGAPGPGGTAQAGRGQPHRPAGDDDRGVRDDVGERQAAQQGAGDRGAVGSLHEANPTQRSCHRSGDSARAVVRITGVTFAGPD